MRFREAGFSSLFFYWIIEWALATARAFLAQKDVFVLDLSELH